MTLKARLRAVGALIVLVLVLVVVLVPRVVRTAQLRRVDLQLSSAVPAFRERYVPAWATPPAKPAQGQSNPFSDIYVAVMTDAGIREELVASRDAPDRSPLAPTHSGHPFVTIGSEAGRKGTWRAGLVALPGARPDMKLLVAVPLERINATTESVRWALTAGAASLAAAVLLGAWWIARLGLRPIAEVTEVADAIAAGDRDRRATETDSGTEAARLARAVNAMLNQRNAAEAKLRQFVADASHELRTPVSAIRGFTDLYRGGGLRDEVMLNDAMRRIGQETHRMGGLVNDLLLLAQLDQGRPLEMTEVNLNQLLEDAQLDASATHPTRAVALDLHPNLTVKGDDAGLRQIFANLITNALVHGGPDATVKVHSSVPEGSCAVEVVDNGLGMEPSEVAHAFDRFWRADVSRQRKGSGSGLGLSIARAIVEAHHGCMTLESTPGQGTRVRVTLPR
jgi:two-component system, OmpR family, sensor kinase